ncbi:hypothetical protein SY88_00610 [Clostridiales bacterium PH28_bin88]|nr:hypothetical protein SY88_00610 [Clostridiales bacterium PH28_bin88]
MEGVIHVVGLGPGSRDYLTPAAERVVTQAEVLVGGRRALDLFAGLSAQRVEITGRLDDAITAIRACYRNHRVVVLVSGDPGFYSLLAVLRRHFPPEELEVIPGISSIQLAFARLKLPWDHATLISLHGRELSILQPFLDKFPLAILTDPVHSPSQIGQYLLSQGVTNRQARICQDLSYPSERIIVTDLEGMAAMEAMGNAVVVITDE